jgi:cyclase
MKRLIVLTVVVVSGALSIAIVSAQQAPTAIHIEKVKDGLYIVTGGRGAGPQDSIAGNTTVFVADSGVVLIDTKYPGFGKAILDQVRSVTPKGENAAFLPAKTFKDRMSLLGGKNRIDLYYFGPGHTNGDAVIVFPALRTAVMGDLFARKWAPLVDVDNGGSATAFPQTLAKALSGIKDVDTVITGHSTTTIGSSAGRTFVPSNPVMKWADLQEYADFMRDFVAAAEAARKAGKSADEAASGLKLPDKYKNYDMAQAKADVQKVYDESKR